MQDLDFLTQLYKYVPARQKKWHIDNNYYEPVKCLQCNDQIVNWSVKTGKYSRFCSSKCAHNSVEVREKTKNTCLDRYGASTNLKLESNKQKQKETLIKKYGVDNFSKSPEFDIKFKKTSLERYGVSNPSKLESVKSKITQTHQERYGRKRQSQSHISTDIIDLKNNRELMLDLYENQKMPLTDIAEMLGVNHSQLCVHFKNNLGIDISRHTTSSVENQILAFLQSRNIDVEQSNRSIISPKEIDIYLPDYRIGIEVNGLAWHSELRGKSRDYHRNKTVLCREQSVRLIHVFDYEWYTKTQLVQSRLINLIGQSNSIGARKCQIRPLTRKESNEFFEINHIQGSCISKLSYGLIYNDQIVAAMSFGKPRFSRSYQWELLRFANKMNTSVVGGAGRLFNTFVNENFPASVISYCDLRWNTGNLYTKLGFAHIGDSGPNYWYTTKKYNLLENRMRYQKHKLKTLLPVFDPDKSEWENMIDNGYDRVWDCGNSTYLWKS